MPQLKVQNQYSSTLTSSLASTGNLAFTVSSPPTYTNGFVVVSPDISTQREVMYFHDVIGSTIYVRSENRISPKAHSSLEVIKMNDVAEIFNTYSDMISQAFYCEKIGWLAVKVWGGYVFYNGNQVAVSDTNLTLVDNTTNYIKYTFNTNTISADVSGTGNIKAVITTLAGAITNIVYRFSKESLIDFTVALTGALPSQTGNGWKSLMTDGTNILWGTNNNLRTGRGVSKILGTNWSGNETEYAQGTSSSLLLADLSTLPILSLPGPIATDSAPESIIATGDIVWQTPDGLYKIQQEVKTSTALGGANTFLWQCNVSAWVHVVMYLLAWNATAVVATTSSADVVTWGTPVNLWACTNGSGWVALIGTNKVVFVQVEGSSATSHTTISTIGTISWSTISLGTPLNTVYTQSAGTPAVHVVFSVFKVRTDVYGFTLDLNSGWSTNAGILQLNTVSGTTITLWTATNYGANGNARIMGCYLADNYIAVAENTTINLTNTIRIYQITWGGTTFANTYTGTVYTWASSQAAYIARYSDTEVIVTNSVNTECAIFTIPWAWSTLVKTSMTANAAVSYGIIGLYTNIYWIHTGTTIIIKQRDLVLGTITGVTALTNMLDSENIMYSNGRIFYPTGATLIPQIINLARVFSIWVAYNTTGSFSPSKNFGTRTSIIKGYRYYTQADGSLSNGIAITNTVTMTNFFGRGIGTNQLMVEV